MLEIEFTVPPEPAALACRGCQREVPAFWVPPRWVMADGKEPELMRSTGRWISENVCTDCFEREKNPDAVSPAVAEARRRQHLIADLQLPPKLARMEIEQLRGDLPQNFAEAIHAARHRGENLYLWSPQPGLGKTHAAVGLLKHYIRSEGVSGQFHVVPDLMDEIRDAIGRHRAGELIDRISRAEALVLDDLGVEVTTMTVAEKLYMIFNRWDSADKKRLVITSNLSVNQIAEKIDPRIASRIRGMCRVVKIEGPTGTADDDYRVKMARERGL